MNSLNNFSHIATNNSSTIMNTHSKISTSSKNQEEPLKKHNTPVNLVYNNKGQATRLTPNDNRATIPKQRQQHKEKQNL